MKTLIKKTLLVLMVAFIAVFTLGVSSKVKAASDLEYIFSSYAVGAQYAENEAHVLDDKITVTTTQCHFTSELRIYSSSTHNGNAIIKNTSSSEKITKFVFNCGNKADTLNVYASNDGLTWELLKEVTTTSTYTDYTVEVSNVYTYFKLDVAGTQQVRIKYMIVTFEKNVDESMNAFFSNLNTVDSYMSLAYQYTSSLVETDVATEKSITFDDTSKRTAFSTEQQVWTENGITVTHNKNTSSNDIAEYSAPVRFYQGSQLVVSMEYQITSITFDCNSSSYADTLKNSISSSLGTVIKNNDKIILDLENLSTDVTITFSGQVRMDGLTTKSFNGEKGEIQEFSGVDFRLKCAIDDSVESLADLPSGKKYTWGIQVKTLDKVMHYDTLKYSSIMTNLDEKQYVVIDLGDVLTEKARLGVTFSVCAYVEIDGVKYYSELVKSLSVVELVQEYYKMEGCKETVQPLVNVLTTFGYTFEQ